MKEDKATHVLVPIAELEEGIKRMDIFIQSHEGYECIASRQRKGVYEDILGIYPHVNPTTQQEYIEQLETALKWYADSGNYLSGYKKGERLIDEDAGLASNYSDKRIENIAKQALKQ